MMVDILLRVVVAALAIVLLVFGVAVFRWWRGKAATKEGGSVRAKLTLRDKRIYWVVVLVLTYLLWDFIADPVSGLFVSSDMGQVLPWSEAEVRKWLFFPVLLGIGIWLWTKTNAAQYAKSAVTIALALLLFSLVFYNIYEYEVKPKSEKTGKKPAAVSDWWDGEGDPVLKLEPTSLPKPAPVHYEPEIASCGNSEFARFKGCVKIILEGDAYYGYDLKKQDPTDCPRYYRNKAEVKKEGGVFSSLTGSKVYMYFYFLEKGESAYGFTCNGV